VNKRKPGKIWIPFFLKMIFYKYGALSSNSSPIKKKKERKNTLKKHHVFGKNAPGAPSTTIKK
jgi:hypothetical protein